MLSPFRKRLNRTADSRIRKNRPSAKLELEPLSDRVMMSATPLAYTTAPLNGTHTVILSVENNLIEIIDNGKVAMTRAVADTSSITLTGGKGTQSLFEIFKTPAGISTTVNLATGDGIFVGDITSDYNPFGTLPMTPGTLTGLTKTPVLTSSPGVLGIQGALTINGSQSAVIVDDSSGAVRKNVSVNASGIAGLAPVAINYNNISKLSVYGAGNSILGTLGNRYAVSGGPARVDLYARNRNDLVSVTTTSGVVNAHGAGGQITLNSSGIGNTFTAVPLGATLTSTGYAQNATGFDTIRAKSSSTTDTAYLNAAASGTNTLTVSPTDAILSSSNYSNEAVGFSTVVARGNSASDVANLTGSGAVANLLTATPDTVTLSGSGYAIRIFNFETTNTTSTTINDTAVLYGVSGNTSTFVGTPLTSRLRGTNFDNTASGFGDVTAFGQSITSVAFLETSSTGYAVLSAGSTQTRLNSANYDITLNGFGTVSANSLSHNDKADFFGTGFWYATPALATMEYSQSQVRAGNFATMTEWMSEETSGPLQTPTGVIVPVTLDSNGTLTKGTSSPYSMTLDLHVQLVAVKGSQYVWNLTTDHERYFGPLSTVLDNRVQFLRALIDPNVEQAMFLGLVRDDALTYDDMRAMFRAAGASSTISGGTMSDLIYIADSMEAVLGASDAIKSLTDHVVFPHAENAYMHALNRDGNSVRVAMGNLAIGASSLVLSELVDVWFNGVAHPEADAPYGAISLSGNMLFGPNGPLFTDVGQGALNDCWLMASLAEAAAQRPDLITGMFTFAGTRITNNGTVQVYTVRLFNDDHEPMYITVDTQVPWGGGYYAGVKDGSFWVALAEKAYAVANGLGWVESGNVGDYDYEALNYGWPDWALRAISPAPADTVTPSNFSNVGNLFNAGKLIVLCTDTPVSSTVVGNHCYALVGYEPTSGLYTLYNPWGEDSTEKPLFLTGDLNFLNRNFEEEGISGAAIGSASALNAAAPAKTVSDEVLSALTDGVAIFLAPETTEVNRRMK